jgi:phospholipase C
VLAPRIASGSIAHKRSTADQDHGYTAEQKAFDAGLMDLFPLNVGSPAPDTSLNLGYFDGNTVTALWNYAQHFAMSDNSFSSTFGPSTPGALNLISGQTNGVASTHLGKSSSRLCPLSLLKKR